MQTTLNTYTVADVCHSFTCNELGGKWLFLLSGKLTIQPQCLPSLTSMQWYYD